MDARDRFFVSTDWLADHLSDPAVAVVDASWFLPTQNRDARAEHLAGHIPGAVFFDIDAIADTRSGLPHMLPAPDAFAAAVGALGIGSDQSIVVYDALGLFSAPRVWWTFRTMGARDVRILDGGLPAWTAEGRPLEKGVVARPAATFVAHFDAAAVRGLDEMRAVLASGDEAVVDARPADRFAGLAPEPRPGVRAGHMPGSRNLPAGELVENGRLKAPDGIRTALAAHGIDPGRPTVASCGSGVTAAIVALALESIGAPRPALYDGSWSEWGGRSDTPVEGGPS